MNLLLLLIPGMLWSATLPPKAQKILNGLPEKAVTVDVVVGRAIEVSDNFAALKSKERSAEIYAWEAQVELDYYLNAGYNWRDNLNQPTPPFGTIRNAGWVGNLGIAKKFSTGTSVAIGWEHGANNLTFPASPGFSFGSQSYAESRVTASLSQDLWKNAFGSATRKRLNQSERSSEAELLSVRSEFESQTIALIKFFYNSWLQQMTVKTSSDSVYRKRRLLKVVKQKYGRGTAVKSEVLQAENSLIDSLNNLDDSKNNLKKSWFSLIENLKWPKEFRKIDPLLIPSKLDNMFFQAKAFCSQVGAREVVDRNPEFRRLSLQEKNIKDSVKAAESEANPELTLKFSYANNGIDGASSEALTEVGYFRHPAWAAGLNLKFPLNNWLAKSKVARLKVNNDMMLAQKQQLRSKVAIDMDSRCMDLENTYGQLSRFQKKMVQQKRRAKIENQRFQRGKVSLFQLIQAEDELSFAELQHATLKVGLRSQAWGLIQVFGYFPKYWSLKGKTK